MHRNETSTFDLQSLEWKGLRKLLGKIKKN